MTKYTVTITTKTTYIVECECEEEAAGEVQGFIDGPFVASSQVQKTSHEILDIETDTV